MKIAILVAGEYREFVLAHKFWTFLKWTNIDCYFATWDTSIFEKYNKEQTVEYITKESISAHITPKSISLDSNPIRKLGESTSTRQINRWQTSIQMMLESGIVYDRVILIRPDLALEYDESQLAKFINEMPNDDNRLYTIIHRDLNTPLDIQQAKNVGDIIMVGTQGAISKLMNLSKPVDRNIHTYLAKNFLSMGISIFNLPIPRFCIVRSNCRGLDLNFRECKEKAKEWWEKRHKRFYHMADNNFDPMTNLEISRFGKFPEISQNSKSINLWDKFDYCDWLETKKLSFWHVPDDEIRYDNNIIDNANSQHITYDKFDIIYSFSNLGFRIDTSGPLTIKEATNYNKILVGGCSVTEGIGLPENHIWHSFLIEQLQKRRSETPIAKFNVAKGGRSIESIIRYAYIFIEHYKFDPDFVLLCLPPINRKEILLLKDDVTPEIYHYMLGVTPATTDSRELKEEYEKNSKTLTYSQNYHDCFRNLLFFKWFCQAKNIPWYFCFWNDDFSQHNISYNLGPVQNISYDIPAELEKQYIPIRMTSAQGPFIQTIARDYMHFGPNSHYQMASDMYAYINKNLDFNNLTGKWNNGS
jgi:hypothetical protein